MTEKELTSLGKIFLDQIDKKFDEKLDPINNRLTNIEQRVTNIEQRVTNIEQRVTNIEQRVTNIEQKITDLTSRVDANSTSLIKIESSLGAWTERQDIQDEAIKKIKVKVGIS